MEIPYIGFNTSNDDSGTLDPMNPNLLYHLGIEMGALSPLSLRFFVGGDLYEVPHIARKNHECAGSINVYSNYLPTGQKFEVSHIFYRDVTGHHGNPYHWNHEIWYRFDNDDFKQYDKRRTAHHRIPRSDSIEIYSLNESDIREEMTIQWEIPEVDVSRARASS